MERLIRLYDEFGQSPWLDNLKRGYLTSGQLAELRDGGIRGLTSNPTIFQKAIADSADYDEQFARDRRRRRRSSTTTGRWCCTDINGACDVFDPLYDDERRAATASSASRSPRRSPTTGRAPRPRPVDLHTTIARRNLMVKIPATAEGVAPIQADDRARAATSTSR